MRPVPRPVGLLWLMRWTSALSFGRGPTSTTLFAVLNAPPPKKKGEARKAYICSWDAQETKDGWKLNRCKVLAGKPITALDIRSDFPPSSFARPRR